MYSYFRSSSLLRLASFVWENILIFCPLISECLRPLLLQVLLHFPHQGASHASSYAVQLLIFCHVHISLPLLEYILILCPLVSDSLPPLCLLLALGLGALSPPGPLDTGLDVGEDEARGLDHVEEDPADHVCTRATGHLQTRAEPVK